MNDIWTEERKIRILQRFIRTYIDGRLMNNRNMMMVMLDVVVLVLDEDISNVQQSDNWMNKVTVEKIRNKEYMKVRTWLNLSIKYSLYSIDR